MTGDIQSVGSKKTVWTDALNKKNSKEEALVKLKKHSVFEIARTAGAVGAAGVAGAVGVAGAYGS